MKESNWLETNEGKKLAAVEKVSWKTLIPYLSIVVIAMGAIKQIYFYGYFKIPIKNFLEVGEILLLFADDILALLLIVILVIIVYITINFLVTSTARNIATERMMKTEIPEPDFRELSEEEDIRNERIRMEIRKMYRWTNYVLAAVVVILIIQSIITGFIYKEYLRNSTNIVLTTVLFFCVVTLFMTQDENFKKYLPYFAPVFVTLGVIFVIFTVTMMDIRRVKDGKYIGTTITTSDSTYVSDSSSFYIGRTNNYSFIWNKKKKTSTVLPNSEIKEMVLKQWGKK